MPSYPIEFNLTGRLTVVVGLGAVGTRKAAGLVEAGARVIGIDPRADLEPINGVELRAEAFRPDHLDGAFLAFAAGPAEVNRQVVEAARAARVIVNAASDPTSGDFTVPAVWRDGPVTLTISTSGASPALARSIRDRAAASIAGAGLLAAMLAEIRPMVIERVGDPERRRRLLMDLGDSRWLDVLSSEGGEGVRRAWLAAIGEADRGSSLHGSAGIA